MYRIGEKIYFGGYSWIVLDIQNEKVLVLSEFVLENRDWGRYSSWVSSDLRRYLNDTFIHELTPYTNGIVKEKIATEDNKWYGRGGFNSEDRIFILSIEEVLRYFGDSGDLEKHKRWDGFQTQGGDSRYEENEDGYFLNDAFNSKRIGFNKSGIKQIWFLRSPGFGHGYVTCVFENGVISVRGRDLDRVSTGGVRPAMWIDFKALNEQKVECEKREAEKAQRDLWVSQGKCGNCGEKLGGLRKKCKSCAQANAPAVEIGSIMRFGDYDWRVLASRKGEMLIVSDKILEERQYNTQQMDITWENCSLRRYLNGEFYNKFNSEEKRKIAKTRLPNKNNQEFGTNGGHTTKDRIFILSIEEVESYFGDNSARVTYDIMGNAEYWWLRSPGSKCDSAAYVHNGGSVFDEGKNVSTFKDYFGEIRPTPCGIRPAMWVKI